jgi:hypothetical protein
MTEKETIKRRIEIKKQLIILTLDEIIELEKKLNGKEGDRLITENRQPEPASLS